MVLQNQATLNIRVINLSLGMTPGESYRTDPLCAAVRKAVKAGIVVVCAAGNQGKNSQGQVVYGGINCPGNEPSAITVGAANTFQNNNRAGDGVDTYSSRGPTYLDHLTKPDLVAPGNKIVSVRAPGSKLDSGLSGEPGSRRRHPARRPGLFPALRHEHGGATGRRGCRAAAADQAEADAERVKAVLMYTAQPLNLTDGPAACRSRRACPS